MFQNPLAFTIGNLKGVLNQQMEPLIDADSPRE